MPGVVTGTGVHTLLFRWLCCVSKQQRLRLATSATDAFWKVLDTMELWAERSSERVGDCLFVFLRGCIACSVKTRRLLRMPIAETTFQVSDRTWTVSSNATPAATPRSTSSHAEDGLEVATSVVIGTRMICLLVEYAYDEDDRCGGICI